MKEVIIELLRQRSQLNSRFISDVYTSHHGDARLAQSELKRFDEQYDYLFKDLINNENKKINNICVE